MDLPIPEQERICWKFFQEVAQKAPFDKYVNGAGIEEDEKGEFLCVYLRKPLPPDLKLPETFENLRVLISGMSEIEPQGSD